MIESLSITPIRTNAKKYCSSDEDERIDANSCELKRYPIQSGLSDSPRHFLSNFSHYEEIMGKLDLLSSLRDSSCEEYEPEAQEEALRQDYASSFSLLNSDSFDNETMDKTCRDTLIQSAQLVGDYKIHVQLLEELLEARDDFLSFKSRIPIPKSWRAFIGMFRLQSHSSRPDKEDLTSLGNDAKHITIPPISIPRLRNGNADIKSMHGRSSQFQGMDKLESTFEDLQEEISICSFICEEIHERSIRSLFYAIEKSDKLTGNVLENKQHDGGVIVKTSNCMIDRMFCDLELFHWVYAELKPKSKQQFPCAARNSRQYTINACKFKETPSKRSHFGLVYFHRSLTQAETSIKAVVQDQFAKTNTWDRRSNTKSLKCFTFWDRIKENIERELDTKARPSISPVFICWVSIRHNDSGKFVSATGGKVSLTMLFDSEKCLFGLHVRPKTNILTGILTRKRQIRSKKQRRLKLMHSTKLAVRFPWAKIGTAKICNKIEDAIEDDYDNDLPSSIDRNESEVIVGFCQRSTGKWLGERSMFGLGGGDVVCESAVYGEGQEWEINDLCRDETALLSVSANRGSGGFAEVINENRVSCSELKIGKKCDKVSMRMASVWSLKELLV
mmetsp:Transcript_29361/g.61151  ORF Transcript_29361/g.61151 Transcript_29361/m.61151 type:complete len:616 (+) Transcript_29361:180-2027(+)